MVQRGEKGETHTYSLVQRCYEKQGEKEEKRGGSTGWTHTHSCDWPFQCFLTKKASAPLPTTAQTVKREVFLEARRVWSYEPQPQMGSAKGLFSNSPLLRTHLRSRLTSQPALDSGDFQSTLSRFLK